MKHISIAGLAEGCSQIILGTSLFTPERKNEVFPILDTYVEHGGNTLDTARIYSLGKSEQVLAMWLKARRNRGRLVIVNKGCHHYIDAKGRHHPDQVRVRPAIITEDLMESLDRMQVDYFDLYLLHRDDPAVPVGELFDCLEEHRQAGLVKAYGVSNWTITRIEEANRYCVRKGYPGIAVNSPSLSLARINEPRWIGAVYADGPYIEWHARTRLPLFAWAAQASGFFTGAYSKAGGPNPDIVRVYSNEDNWEGLRRADALAADRGKGYTANHIALAYVLSQSFPVGAIIGPHRREDLQASLMATGINLSEAEIRWLELRNDKL